MRRYRYVGDKYYNACWQKNMLENKVYHNNIICVPREDDYFFSLLYHCKVQKNQVKEKYKPILQDLAHKLQFEWYSEDLLKNDEVIGKILGGFYQAQNYIYEDPIDTGVFKNKKIISFLPSYLNGKGSNNIRKKLKNIEIKVKTYIASFLIKKK